MKIVGVVSLMALSLVLVACGTQSDPRQRFSDVETVPLHDQPTDIKKVYKDAKLFVVTVPNGNLNFVEGKTASYSIAVATQYPNASYRLKASNLPDSAVFAPVSGSKGVYSLTWTPKIGTLPVGKPSDKFTFDIDVEVDPASTTTDSNKLREIAGPGYDQLKITLNKTAENPTFDSVTLASKEVMAGEPVAITLVTKAQGVPADGTLTLEIEDPKWSSKEITFVKAKSAVTFQPPVRSGDTFTFTGLIDTKSLEIPNKKTPVEARFLVRLVNKALDLKSTVETVNLTVLPKPEEPAPPKAAPQAPPKAAPQAPAPAKPVPAKPAPKAQPPVPPKNSSPKPTIQPKPTIHPKKEETK